MWSHLIYFTINFVFFITSCIFHFLTKHWYHQNNGNNNKWWKIKKMWWNTSKMITFDDIIRSSTNFWPLFYIANHDSSDNFEWKCTGGNLFNSASRSIPRIGDGLLIRYYTQTKTIWMMKKMKLDEKINEN